jgi:rubrerythrin
MDMHAFFAKAIGLELAAERIYRKLADCIRSPERRDTAEFFLEMAEFSRRHRERIADKADSAGIRLAEGADSPSAGELGEMPHPAAVSGNCDLDGAMELALAAEHRGVAFYENFARVAVDLRVRELADEFAEEERGHVLALERFMGLKPY